MLIIGLMVIALICLAVGLVLPSSAWLIASLIATAGAGYLVWKMRSAIAPAGTAGSAVAPPADAMDATAAEPAKREPADSEPADSERADTAVIDAVDRSPDSTADTTVMSAVPSEDATQVIAAVPTDTRGTADTSNAAVTPDADAGDVWVIDGRPRYHLGTCPIIQGQDAEPIPFDQAVEDGFMPCSLCEPQMARTSR